MKNIIALLVALPLVGCSTYSHQRVTADGTTEITKVSGFISKATAKGISSKVVDGNYSRLVALESISGNTELEKLGPLLEYIAKGIVEGMKENK